MALDGDAPRREVRAGDDAGQVFRRRVRAFQQQMAGVDQFADIVWRYRGRHAHGDAGRAVGQKIGEAGRQDDRLFILIVIGGLEVHRVLLDPLHQEHCGRGQLALGVAHGRGVIAVDIPEIALTVDQRIPLRKVLRQPHQGVIDRGVAVRVIAAHDLADDLGAFARRRLRVQPHLVHRVHDTPVHGLETVAHIREGAIGDGRQRIGQIATRQRFAHRLIDDASAFRRRGMNGHGPSNRVFRSRSLGSRRPKPTPRRVSPRPDRRPGSPAPAGPCR